MMYGRFIFLGNKKAHFSDASEISVVNVHLALCLWSGCDFYDFRRNDAYVGLYVTQMYDDNSKCQPKWAISLPAPPRALEISPE